MASVTIKVEGLSELGRQMAALKADMAQNMARRATGKAASVVRKTAKANLHAKNSETGTLERAVIAKKMPKSQTDLTSEHIVTVKKSVYQKNPESGQRHTRRVGVFNEFGTVNMGADPWLGPALTENTQRAADVMADSLRKDLEKYGGSST